MRRRNKSRERRLLWLPIELRQWAVRYVWLPIQLRLWAVRYQWLPIQLRLWAFRNQWLLLSAAKLALDVLELAGLGHMHVVMDRPAAAGIRRIAALIGGSWTNHQWRFRRRQWRWRQGGGWVIGGLRRKKAGVFGGDHWS
jgi:hypothetical protein